jgi:hypothetical protein
MFGTDPTDLSTSLFKMITKIAREGGSQIINNAQEHNFSKEIDDLEEVGEDMLASVSQQENPTQKAFTVLKCLQCKLWNIGWNKRPSPYKFKYLNSDNEETWSSYHKSKPTFLSYGFLIPHFYYA